MYSKLRKIITVLCEVYKRCAAFFFLSKQIDVLVKFIFPGRSRDVAQHADMHFLDYYMQRSVSVGV